MKKIVNASSATRPSYTGKKKERQIQREIIYSSITFPYSLLFIEEAAKTSVCFRIQTLTQKFRALNHFQQGKYTDRSLFGGQTKSIAFLSSLSLN